MIPIDVNAISQTVTSLDNLVTLAKSKLLNNPGEASIKLAEVLEELSKILDFIERETVRYLEIIFLPDKSNFISCRSALLSFESGYISIKGYEARGHCHKISNIYEKYLNHWFSKVLDRSEAESFKIFFDNMNSGDFDMVHSIQSLTDSLKDESKEILDLIDDDKLEDANYKLKAARKVLQQTRRSIVDSLARLKLLQASFIASSQIV
jgi:hypothetical protein